MGNQKILSEENVYSNSGNSDNISRKAFSARFIGDDVKYIDRHGETSPPFNGINLQTGDKMRNDWFPIVWSTQ